MTVPVSAVTLRTEEEFLESVYPKRQPTVLRGLHLGRAPEIWTADYLRAQCGSHPVKVHVCPVPQADFVRKNFAYKTLPFDEFVHRASQEKNEECFFCPEEKYYLRSLGTDPRKDVADFGEQFPTLAADLKLPRFFKPDQFFSSVLRIGSAGFQLWTHYDVMDNLLVQVCGRKRVTLYPPQDASYLYLSGDKSRVLDIDSPDFTTFPNFRKATRHECVLEPGDVLFVPALWFHNVLAMEFGVAVNVFWKNLDAGLYDTRDTYGNRDLLPAQRAVQITDRALKALQELPDQYRDFYARCLVERIRDKAFSKEPADS